MYSIERMNAEKSLWRHYVLPLVLNGLGAGQPLLHVDAHQGPDEGLGLVADVVPVRRVELEFAWKMG